MVQIQIREHQRGERREPQAARREVDGAAQHQRHEGRHVGEAGQVDRGDAPAGGEHEDDQGDGHGRRVGGHSRRFKRADRVARGSLLRLAGEQPQEIGEAVDELPQLRAHVAAGRG